MAWFKREETDTHIRQYKGFGVSNGVLCNLVEITDKQTGEVWSVKENSQGVEFDKIKING